MAFQTREKHPKLKSKVESKVTKAFGPIRVFKRKDGTVSGDRRPVAVAVTDTRGVQYARDSRGVIRRMAVKGSKRARRMELGRREYREELDARVKVNAAQREDGAA